MPAPPGAGPASVGGPGSGGGGPDLRKWEYIGVGCLTSLIGFFGGGMIAVLVARIAGAVQGCPPDPETGAPCYWHLYWITGALLGVTLVPLVAIRKLRRSRINAPVQTK